LAGAALAGVASLAAFALHVAGARFLGVPAWYGLFFPVGYTLAAAMALDGLVRRGSGHIRWKGRVYPRPAARASE
ncbi:MAG TPA: hypothetical protein VFA22_00445, partial [Stellaceae bacterium]|nr:hypothetical protein [Stellaceae bacterium]